MSRDIPLFLADEGFNRDVIRGVLSRDPALMIVRVQDVGLTGTSDSEILEWGAKENRIVLTHDENSLLADANLRLSLGLPMPGVVVVHQDIPTGRAIEGLLELIGTTIAGEWDYQIRYVLRQ